MRKHLPHGVCFLHISIITLRNIPSKEACMQRSRGAVSGRKHLFSFCAVLSFILFLAPFANAAGKSFKVTLLTEGTKSDVPNQLAIRGLQEASSLYFIQTNVLNLREKFFFFPCETCRSPGRLNGLENNMSS